MTLPDILNMSLQLWNCKVLSRAIEAISLQKVGRHSGYGSRQNTNGNYMCIFIAVVAIWYLTQCLKHSPINVLLLNK